MPTVSLVKGWFPPLLTMLAPAVAIAALLGRSRRWWRRSAPIIVGMAALVTVVLAWLLWLTNTINDHYPPSFLLWVTLTFITLGVAGTTWRPRTAARRVGAVAAVPLMAMWCGLLINSHYAYYPDTDALFGSNRPGEVSSQQFTNLLNAGTSTSTTGHNSAAPTTRSSSSPLGTQSSPSGTSSSTTAPVRTPSLVDWRPNGPLPALGEITEIDIPATVSKFPHRKAYVYVPPAFKAVPRPTLPVLVMLVGTPGQPKNWLSAADADKTANAYAAAHFGLAPIMVMPDANGSFTGDTECADGPRGNAETYLAVDVPNWIRQEFSVPMDPTRWAVAGLSEGGTCAIMLALRYPETFGRFMTLSGDLRPNLGSRADTINSIYGGDASQWDAHDPLLIMARHRFGSTSGFFAAGTGESAKLTAARHLSEAAIAAGMDTELHVASGAQHNFLAWTAAFKVGLPWIASRLGLP